MEREQQAGQDQDRRYKIRRSETQETWGGPDIARLLSCRSSQGIPPDSLDRHSLVLLSMWVKLAQFSWKSPSPRRSGTRLCYTVPIMLQHYLLLWRSADALFSEGTQAGHLCRGPATQLRTVPSLPTGGGQGWDLHRKCSLPRGCAWVCNVFPAVTWRRAGSGLMLQVPRFQLSGSPVTANDGGDFGTDCTPWHIRPLLGTAVCHAGWTRYWGYTKRNSLTQSLLMLWRCQLWNEQSYRSSMFSCSLFLFTFPDYAANFWHSQYIKTSA